MSVEVEAPELAAREAREDSGFERMVEGLKTWLAKAEGHEDLLDCPRELFEAARLTQLAERLGLDERETTLLALLAAWEVDLDVARQLVGLAAARGLPGWVSFALVASLVGPLELPRLTGAAPLRHHRLIRDERRPDEGGSSMTSALRIDERILAHLLGIDRLDERLEPYVHPIDGRAVLTPAQAAVAEKMVRLWRGAETFAALPLIRVEGKDPEVLRSVASVAALDVGLRMFELGAASLPGDAADRNELARLWDREAILGRCALFVDDTARTLGPASALGREQRILGEWLRRCSGVVVHATTPDQRGSLRAVSLSVPEPDEASRLELLRAAAGESFDDRVDELRAVSSQFELSASDLYEACVQSLPQGQAGGESDPLARLWQACRDRARPQLGPMVQWVQSRVGWDDLVLRPDQLGLLRAIGTQVRHRAQVHHQWGFAAKGERGLGIAALFAGPSGTGKTMAAEVIANDVGLDLLRVDLSAVVSKYIGETEENLRAAFDAADKGGAVLLFDEADALFGPRSEVKDSRDRHANMEVSYLLQRLECYRGLAILTTNFPDNIDRAFLRRFRFFVEFPFPSPVLRSQLWRKSFPPATPLGELDFESLGRLSLTGGHIRNIAINAAFLAADGSGQVELEHIERAARIEFAKMDKPMPELRNLARKGRR